jgi:hypothetical protein
MLEVRIALDPATVPPQELERLHDRLRTHLDDAGLERITAVTRDDPAPGARGVKELALGAFDAALPKAAAAVIGAFARSIGEFVRRSGHDVQIEIRGDKITIGKADDAQVERLITHFIAETTKSLEP